MRHDTIRSHIHSLGRARKFISNRNEAGECAPLLRALPSLANRYCKNVERRTAAEGASEELCERADGRKSNEKRENRVGDSFSSQNRIRVRSVNNVHI